MKYKILELLKNSNGYLSGAEISDKLGITRSAVWKNINTLKKEGYNIKSLHGTGYVFDNLQDKLSPVRIEDCVPGELYFYSKVLSTNEEAKRKKDVPDRSLFLAETQTAGRGRMGRKWVSRGNGIWMSIYLKPDVPPCDIAQLTLLAGIAVSRVIKNSKIKWPNDVIMSGRKVCGILTEMTAEADRITSVVIGIGVNVNTETFGIDLVRKATSVYLETGKKADRNQLICEILTEFWEIYDEFRKNGFANLRREYKRRCVTLNREILIVKGDDVIKAYAEDINDRGELIAKTENSIMTVNSGEVSVRGILGYN